MGDQPRLLEIPRSTDDLATWVPIKRRMSKLETFKLPNQDTRLIKCNNTVYKFKLQYRDGSNRLPCDADTMQQEMERDKPKLTQADINEVLNTEYGHVFTPPPPKKVKRKHMRQDKVNERRPSAQQPKAIGQNKERPETQTEEMVPGPSSVPTPSTSRKTYRLGRRHKTVDTPISGRPRRILLHTRPDRHAIESFQLAEQQRLQQLACPTTPGVAACNLQEDTQPDHTQETSVVGSFLRMLIHPARQLFRGNDTS
ncbi:Hypp2564 [Branchiostoma lanceolatum]|uniref:Hypp2564 protein n=1 Tax=Branchiostoma lanceolatum TaxID=7740 RepID=A0A8J9ZSI3_BRALA|nr:Hypp2564 [Branchiostoma lanceolatum]